MIADYNNLHNFATHWLAIYPFRGGSRLKGNQVRILNSPAAVCSDLVTGKHLFSHWM